MLTLEDLKDMEPGIFRSGSYVVESSIDIIDKDWVAVRGQVCDWVIYESSIERVINTPEALARWGHKIRNPEIIRRLVECSPEAFEVYRFH